MTHAREQILANLARSLGRGPLPPERVAELDRRISAHPVNTIPGRSQVPAAAQVDLFERMADAAAATVARVQTNDEVPDEVARYLGEEGLLAEIVVGPADELSAIPWDEEKGLQVRRGRAGREGEVAVTGAFAAIAETGTLMLLSGSDRPTGNVFLPETHIVVLGTDQVVGPLEAAWDKLRADGGGNAMPRTVNLVTGPSRTGDIEAVMYMGAHGPRRLHIVLVG
jgi:L-lactate dehydrogenase complex protein LldG